MFTAELQLVFHALNPNRGLAFTKGPWIDWNKLYTLASRHRLCHQVYAYLTSIKDQVPISVYQRFTEHCQQESLHILATASETVRIAREFTKYKLHHCFVKGIVLNSLLYDRLTARPCKDIDVWVSLQDYQQATKVLMSLGYQKILPNYEFKTAYQETYYRAHNHDMSFYNPKRGILVELHYTLSKSGLDFPISSAAMESIDVFNTPIKTLQTNYHLLYLMIHGALHGWMRLRWLNDIALFINSKKCDLEQVRILAKEINSEHILDQSLILIQHYFGLINWSSASNRGKKLAKMAQIFIEAEFEIIPGMSIYNSLLINFRLYMLKITPWRRCFITILGSLIKIDKLFPYFSLPRGLSFIYYLLCPFLFLKRFIPKKLIT